MKKVKEKIMFKRLGDARDAMLEKGLVCSVIKYDKSMECDIFEVDGNEDTITVFWDKDDDKDCLCWLSNYTGMDFEFTTMKSFIESVNHPPFKGSESDDELESNDSDDDPGWDSPIYEEGD